MYIAYSYVAILQLDVKIKGPSDLVTRGYSVPSAVRVLSTKGLSEGY